MTRTNYIKNPLRYQKLNFLPSIMENTNLEWNTLQIKDSLRNKYSALDYKSWCPSDSLNKIWSWTWQADDLCKLKIGGTWASLECVSVYMCVSFLPSPTPWEGKAEQKQVSLRQENISTPRSPLPSPSSPPQSPALTASQWAAQFM